MPAPPLPAPAATEPQTVFRRLERERTGARPWIAFIFDQGDAVMADGTPVLNSVGQPRMDGRDHITTLWTDDPAKLADLEARAAAYVRGEHGPAKGVDSAETTVAYEELEAARAAGSVDAIRALGYRVLGTFNPWT